MENNLSDGLFQKFSQLVYEQCGINLHEGKKALLQARLNKRLRLTGIDSYEEYFKLITSAANAGEFVHFLDSISTNLTYFFRESQHFDFLEQVALPEMIAKETKGQGFQDQDLERRVFDRRGTIQPCDVCAGTSARNPRNGISGYWRPIYRRVLCKRQAAGFTPRIRYKKYRWLCGRAIFARSATEMGDRSTR